MKCPVTLQSLLSFSLWEGKLQMPSSIFSPLKFCFSTIFVPERHVQPCCCKSFDFLPVFKTRTRKEKNNIPVFILLMRFVSAFFRTSIWLKTRGQTFLTWFVISWKFSNLDEKREREMWELGRQQETQPGNQKELLGCCIYYCQKKTFTTTIVRNMNINGNCNFPANKHHLSVSTLSWHFNLFFKLNSFHLLKLNRLIRPCNCIVVIT